MKIFGVRNDEVRKKKNKVFHFCYAECSANLSKITTNERSNKRLWMINSGYVRCCYMAFKKNGLYLLLIAYRLFQAIGMRCHGRGQEGLFVAMVGFCFLLLKPLQNQEESLISRHRIRHFAAPFPAFLNIPGHCSLHFPTTFSSFTLAF